MLDNTARAAPPQTGVPAAALALRKVGKLDPTTPTVLKMMVEAGLPQWLLGDEQTVTSTPVPVTRKPEALPASVTTAPTQTSTGEIVMLEPSQETRHSLSIEMEQHYSPEAVAARVKAITDAAAEYRRMRDAQEI